MPDQLSARAIWLKTLTSTLNTDPEMRKLASAGGWYLGATSDKTKPHIEWQLKADKRTSTFGGEAFREVGFRLTAIWNDSGGANYLHGERMLERARFLLDAGASRDDNRRILAAINALTRPDGWKCLAVFENETDNASEDHDMMPSPQNVGQDSSAPFYSMGYAFCARLARL